MKASIFSKYALVGLLATSFISCNNDDENTVEKYQVYEKHVQLEGEDNMRDMGGYIGKDGKRVVFRKLFRSGELSALTVNDIATMKSLGIKTIVDLRTETERNEHPDVTIEGFNRIELSLIEESSVASGQTDYMSAILSGEVDASEMLLSAYTIDAHRIQVWTTIFNHLEENNITLWHCTAGKDRAGMTAALILSSLGVDRDVIINDFMASNIYLSDYIEGTISYINNTYGNNSGELLRPLLGVEIEYIEAFLNKIDQDYGSMSAFLDLLDVDINKMQENYLEK
ncbi:tyrosine-protein phosphatase [Flavobacterium chuncheonense]|uniref:Tyrosine-protein phosphatase n=1 Tax=Flavobacterium chuncheonense TaxID=2026653 RepID=A0ABW5YJJ1_9FLAO